MWVICDKAIEQLLELSFQTLFAGASQIRHRGSEESVNAVAASMFNIGSRLHHEVS